MTGPEKAIEVRLGRENDVLSLYHPLYSEHTLTLKMVESSSLSLVPKSGASLHVTNK